MSSREETGRRGGGGRRGSPHAHPQPPPHPCGTRVRPAAGQLRPLYISGAAPGRGGGREGGARRRLVLSTGPGIAGH